MNKNRKTRKNDRQCHRRISNTPWCTRVCVRPTNNNNKTTERENNYLKLKQTSQKPFFFSLVFFV